MRARESAFKMIFDASTREEVLRGIEEQREHFDNLGLHIGYIYGDNSIPSQASICKPAFVPGAEQGFHTSVSLYLRLRVWLISRLSIPRT